jgi:hypothetical protein
VARRGRGVEEKGGVERERKEGRARQEEKEERSELCGYVMGRVE